MKNLLLQQEMGNNPGILKKIQLTTKVLKNWPLVLFDKSGLKKSIRYITRSGIQFFARGQSTDVNTAVAVFSGLEYPAEFLKVKPGDTVLDLGANIGAFPLYLNSLYPKIEFHGYAIEPDRSNFEILKKNLDLNGVKFDTYNIAISSQNGTANLTHGTKANAVALTDEPTGLRVTTKKLSTFCQEKDIDRIGLMKIDVEGAEYDIFITDMEFIRERVDSIILEYHNLTAEKNKTVFLKILENSFKIRELSSNGRVGILFCEKL